MRQEETERRLVFDINDFDETLPGPWEWDIKRLITSIEICGRHRGFSEDDRTDTILAAARMYREMMLRFSETGNMSMWYEHMLMQRPAIDMKSPAISAKVMLSIKRCSSLPGHMRIKMRGTMKCFVTGIVNSPNSRYIRITSKE